MLPTRLRGPVLQISWETPIFPMPSPILKRCPEGARICQDGCLCPVCPMLLISACLTVRRVSQLPGQQSDNCMRNNLKLRKNHTRTWANKLVSLSESSCKKALTHIDELQLFQIDTSARMTAAKLGSASLSETNETLYQTPPATKSCSYAAKRTGHLPLLLGLLSFGAGPEWDKEDCTKAILKCHITSPLPFSKQPARMRRTQDKRSEKMQQVCKKWIELEGTVWNMSWECSQRAMKAPLPQPGLVGKHAKPKKGNHPADRFL